MINDNNLKPTGMNLDNEVHVPLMSIRLSGESDFSKNFNYVGELFTKWQELPEGEEKETAWNQYFDAKFALEMGNLNIPE